MSTITTVRRSRGWKVVGFPLELRQAEPQAASSERQVPRLPRSTRRWSGTRHSSHLAAPRYLPFPSNLPPARSRMRRRIARQAGPR